MKVLLDECLPRKMKRGLVGHEVFTVPEKGWTGVKNGALLQLAEANFDVFVTVDGNMRYQQNLSEKNLAFIVLSAPDNTLETLEPLTPQILTALISLQPGSIVKIQTM